MEAGAGAPEEPRPRSRRQPHRLRGAYKRFLLLLARVSTGLRIQPLRKLNIDQGEDRISALPDDVLLGILERLDLRDAVRAGAVSTRWRHLPRRLSRLHLDARHFHGATSPVETMEAFTGAMCRLLSVRPPPAECKFGIKTLVLDLFPVPGMSSLGRAVEDVVNRGDTECLEFHICSPYVNNTALLRAELGKQFMSFSRACPVAFGWLTNLTLNELAFGHSHDVANLIIACNRLQHLSLKSCSLVDRHSTLKIDTPGSGLQALKLIRFRCTQIELISVPKLTTVWCQSWCSQNPPLRFGYVPQLQCVFLISRTIASQVPFTLSECLSSSAMNLSYLFLGFGNQMIWVQPEHPKQLAATFGNLTSMGLFSIFPECDLSWTLFILEAAPALQTFRLSRGRGHHSCLKMVEESAKETNVVWEPSKDLKHPNLRLLQISGFEEEEKVTNYIRLVMELAVGLKRIELRGEYSCMKCDAIDPRRSQVDEARRRGIKERLTHGSSSSVEIVMCWKI